MSKLLQTSGEANKPIKGQPDTYPEAKIIGAFVQSDNTLLLELQVNIEGQDLPISLPLNAFSNLASTNPEVVEAIRDLKGMIYDLHFGLGETLPDLTNSIHHLAKAISEKKNQRE